MFEATPTPALRHAATEAHIQRSLLAWQMIAALRALPAHLLARYGKGAAPQDGPSAPAACAA